jgi:outer membrane protein OmpA-like peptidoglycan-associated protein
MDLPMAAARARGRALLLAGAVLVAGDVLAQDAGQRGSALQFTTPGLTMDVRELKFETRDLALPVIGLTFKIEDVGGQVQPLQLKETATEIRIELPADILFDFDKADIRAAAQPALRQAADLLRRHARGPVTIEGHTDAKGTPAYNKRLSDRRATSVQRWLIEREGLRELKFAPKGLAATKPVAPNAKPDGSDDPEGRQRNRRVEIVFGKR